MYTKFFKLSEPPFSLTPDPRYLYMTERHREGLAHLLYGVQQQGGFVQLTGEIGCGKTTLCRCLVNQLPPQTDIALLLNPRLTVIELLAAFCDELKVSYPADTESVKVIVDAINRHLLDAHSRGRRTVLIIDEAQNLDPDVLEQIRLLTNLETEKEKLLQIILIGQPELLTVLKDPGLRQLAQRITARYHLIPLSRQETYTYIHHRLAIAGVSDRIFSKKAQQEVYRCTQGIPRLINILCDRAMLGAYSLEKRRVSRKIVRNAGKEVRGVSPRNKHHRLGYIALCTVVVLLAGILAHQFYSGEFPDPGKENPEMAKIDNPADSSAPLLQELSEPENETPDTESDTSQDTELPASHQTETDRTEPEETDLRSDIPFSEVVQSASPQYSLVSSFNSLYSRWGVPLSIRPSQMGCQAGRSYGLECIFMTGNWHMLKRLDMPGILGIQFPNEEKQYVTLIGLNENTATLIIGSSRHSFPLQEIGPLWDGSVIFIWKPPFDKVRLPLGMQGDEIAWVNQTLDVYEGNSVLTQPADLFDEKLRQRILQFQKSESLVEDGRIGPETLIRLTIARDSSSIPILSRYSLEGERS